MKKIRPLLLCSLLPLSAGLFSCASGENAGPVSLLFGTREFDGQEGDSPISHMKKLTDRSVLEAMVRRQENFVLLVLGEAHETCGCWNTFHAQNIVRFQQETGLLIHYLYSNELAEDYGMDVGTAKATIGIFRDGALAYQNSDADENAPFYRDYSSFRSWMLERICLPRVFYLTREQLSAKYDETSPFAIYFSRQTCGDCARMQSGAFRSYFEERPTGIETSYAIDLDSVGIGAIEKDGEIIHRSTAENATPEQKEAQRQYEAFKEEYGLVESEGNPAGYGQGYVPTFFHVNPEGNGKKTGDVIDLSAVFYNDKVENGAFAESYFTAERLALESLSYLRESDVEHKVLQDLATELPRNEAYKAYHDPILVAYLDAAIGTL